MTCLPLATAKDSSGTSFVITEPAPTYAPLPILTGATNDELVPIKLLSPTVVLCLFVPS